MVSAFGEHEARSRNQVAHGGRHQYLARPGKGRDARADNHRHPGELAIVELALAHVNAHPRVQAERLESVDDRLGAPDRPRGSVEGSEEAVSGRVLLPAVEPAQLPPHERVMTREQVAPASVTEL